MNMNGIDATDGMADYMKELENEIEESVEEEVVEDKEPEEVVEEVVEEYEEEEEESGEDSILDEEVPEELPKENNRQNKAFAIMRQQNKEMAEQMQKMREEMARIQGAQDVLTKPNEEPVNQEPDKNLYPEEWMDWKTQQLEKKQEEFEKAQGQMSEQMKIQREYAGMQHLEGEYRKVDSKYDEALDYVMKQEAIKIKFQYPQATDEQIRQHLESQKLEMFRANPADAAKNIVEMAKATGFSDEKKPKKKTNIKNLKENVEKHTNVMGGSGASHGSEVTSDQILDMSMDELMRVGKSGFNQAITDSKRKR